MSNAIARRLETMLKTADIKSIDVANILQVRPETVSRWNQGKAFPRLEHQQLILELAFISEQLADFYEPREARLWLLAPQKLLNGEKPVDLVTQGRSKDVMATIDRLRESAYL